MNRNLDRSRELLRASNLFSIVRHKTNWRIFSIAIFFHLSAGCAPSQPNPRFDLLEKKMETLEARIADMEHRVDLSQIAKEEEENRKLQERVDKKVEELRRSQRFFLSELDSLKQDIQLIANENESTLSKVKSNSQAHKKLQKRLGDLIISIDELKDFFSANVDISPLSKPGEGKSERAEVFRTAYRLYKAKRLTKSQKLFRDYRQMRPDTDLTDDALYFVAYIHFLQHRYDEAILHFFELIKQFPKSNWHNDAKWWLAIALERTKDVVAAIDIYRELEKLKPDHPYHHRAKNRLAELQEQ